MFTVFIMIQKYFHTVEIICDQIILIMTINWIEGRSNIIEIEKPVQFLHDCDLNNIQLLLTQVGFSLQS